MESRGVSLKVLEKSWKVLEFHWKSLKSPGTLMQKVLEKAKKCPGKFWNLNQFSWWVPWFSFKSICESQGCRRMGGHFFSSLPPPPLLQGALFWAWLAAVLGLGAFVFPAQVSHNWATCPWPKDPFWVVRQLLRQLIYHIFFVLDTKFRFTCDESNLY